MTFKPTSNVNKLLYIVEECKLNWIADQVRRTIQDGKLLKKQFKEHNRGMQKEGLETVAFNETEQMRIAIRTIYHYTQNLYDVWNNAQRNIHSVFEIRTSHIIVESVESEPIKIYSEDIKESLLKLTILLKEAWPHDDIAFDAEHLIEGERK